MIKTMLDAGQNVNLSNPSDGFTGLHYAVDSGNLEAVRALLFRHAGKSTGHFLFVIYIISVFSLLINIYCRSEQERTRWCFTFTLGS